MLKLSDLYHERIDEIPIIEDVCQRLHLAELGHKHFGAHGLQDGLNNETIVYRLAKFVAYHQVPPVYCHHPETLNPVTKLYIDKQKKGKSHFCDKYKYLDKKGAIRGRIAETLNPVTKLYIDKHNIPITSSIKLNSSNSKFKR